MNRNRTINSPAGLGSRKRKEARTCEAKAKAMTPPANVLTSPHVDLVKVAAAMRATR